LEVTFLKIYLFFLAFFSFLISEHAEFIEDVAKSDFEVAFNNL